MCSLFQNRSPIFTTRTDVYARLRNSDRTVYTRYIKTSRIDERNICSDIENDSVIGVAERVRDDELLDRMPVAGDAYFRFDLEGRQTTIVSLTSCPILSMSIVTWSPSVSVNDSGGTSAVPVSRTTVSGGCCAAGGTKRGFRRWSPSRSSTSSPRRRPRRRARC